MTDDTVAHRPKDNPHGLRALANGYAKGRFLEALPNIVRSDPSIASAFLITSKAAHLIVSAQLYHDLDVEISLGGTWGQASPNDNAAPRSCCPGPRERAKLYNVLSNSKYAAHVRVLRFRHPCPRHAPAAAINDATRESDRVEAWQLASDLLQHCPKLEDVSWQTGFGVSEELWKALSQLKGLRGLSLTFPPLHPAHVTATPPLHPRLTPALQQVVPRGYENGMPNSDIGVRAIGHEGLALGGAWENLETLKLEGLSLQGAWTIASHLELLADLEDSHPHRLHTLSLATHFLDSRLCKAVANFGALRTLKHITLSTTGTKLNAECLKDVLRGCAVLESLKLSDVEGRLDKNTWGMIDTWPTSLNSLEIELTETGTHHSWVLKHLFSIAEVPICQLKRFAVRRLLHPVANLPFPPPHVLVPPQLASHKTEPIPSELLDLIRSEGDLLEDLCLDWWEISGLALEAILLTCPRLRKLQVAVKATVLEIIGMTTAFGNVPDLVELCITSDPKLVPAAGIKVKATKKKSMNGSDLPLFLAEKVAESDPTLVEVRDLRKFARRLPEFRVLRWIGRQGKGEWRFTNSKKTSLSPVDFVHSAVLTKDVWHECQLKPPSFEFEDNITNSPQQLQIPVSPERLPSSEFPALSRTNTSSTISLAYSPTTPTAQMPIIRRSSSTTSANNANPLGLEWDPLPPVIKPPPPPARDPNYIRKPVSIPIGAAAVRQEAPPTPKASENRTRRRGRRDSKTRQSTAPPSSPTKEPRYVPGPAPKKQSTPPSPRKGDKEIKSSSKDKDCAKDRRPSRDESGWETVVKKK